MKFVILIFILILIVSSVYGYDTPFLKGNCIFYLKNEYNEDFQIKIIKRDLNWVEGEDILNITLIYPNGKIYRYTIEDDGIVNRSRTKFIQEFIIDINNDPGIYTLIFDVSKGGDFEYKLESSIEKLMIYGNEIFLREPASLYFHVGNAEEITIFYKNPFKEQKIKFYVEDIFISEIKLIKTKTWEKITIKVPENFRNKIWRLEVSDRIILRFKGIDYGVSFYKNGIFQPINYKDKKSILFIFMSIIAAISTLKIRKYGFFVAFLFVLLIPFIPTTIDVDVVEYKIDAVEINGLNINVVKSSDVSKFADVVVFPSRSVNSLEFLEGNFIVVPEFILKDENFYKWIYKIVKKDKILMPSYMPTLILLLAILILMRVMK